MRWRGLMLSLSSALFASWMFCINYRQEIWSLSSNQFTSCALFQLSIFIFPPLSCCTIQDIYSPSFWWRLCIWRQKSALSLWPWYVCEKVQVFTMSFLLFLGPENELHDHLLREQKCASLNQSGKCGSGVLSFRELATLQSKVNF